MTHEAITVQLEGDLRQQKPQKFAGQETLIVWTANVTRKNPFLIQHASRDTRNWGCRSHCTQGLYERRPMLDRHIFLKTSFWQLGVGRCG